MFTCAAFVFELQWLWTKVEENNLKKCKIISSYPVFAERFPLLLHVSPDIHIYDMANKSVESSKKITRFELAFFNLLFNIRNDFSGESFIRQIIAFEQHERLKVYDTCEHIHMLIDFLRPFKKVSISSLKPWKVLCVLWTTYKPEKKFLLRWELEMLSVSMRSKVFSSSFSSLAAEMWRSFPDANTEMGFGRVFRDYKLSLPILVYGLNSKQLSVNYPIRTVSFFPTTQTLSSGT
jgi:hypothetical protein